MKKKKSVSSTRGPFTEGRRTTIKPYPHITALSISSPPMDAGSISSPDTIPLDPHFYLPMEESCDTGIWDTVRIKFSRRTGAHAHDGCAPSRGRTGLLRVNHHLS